MATKKKAAPKKKTAPKKAVAKKKTAPVKKSAPVKKTEPVKKEKPVAAITKDNTSDIVKKIIDHKIAGLKNREIVALGFNKHTVNSQTSLFNCGLTTYQGANKPLRKVKK